jgi:hypothetical protein
MRMTSLLSSIFHVFPSSDEAESATLLDGQAKTLLHEEGRVLHCDYGKLWVTIEGDPEDIILTEDQSFELPYGRRVVVSGLESGGYSFAG